MTELPVLIMGKNQKILLSEFDLYSYPGLFLKGNADRMAMDYLREQSIVNSDTKLHIKMARNGGFAEVISQ